MHPDAVDSLDLPMAPPVIYERTGKIRLDFSHIIPGDASRCLVPAYHFRILDSRRRDAGHINFRVGDTPHIIQVAGHIGYEIVPGFRGSGFAALACHALAPFVSKIYRSVIITTNPDNLASRHIIENKLGARFLNQVAVTPDDPAYASGARWKRRYRWDVQKQV